MDTVLAIAAATPLLDMLDLDTAVDTTEDLDTAVATPLLDTLVLATAVATTDTDTVTAVDTDTSVKPRYLDKIFTSRIMTVESLNWQCQCSQIPDCRIFL